MAGLFTNLLNAGAAYLQHRTAVRKALALPESESLASLSSYVSGLSEASFVGFKLTIAGQASQESDTALKQQLQWIVANADALRLGQVETAPANNAAAIESQPGLSFEATLELIDPWFSLPQEEARVELHAALARMSDDERRQFIGHLNTGVDNSRENLQHLKDNESTAWGSYAEDQILYRLAKARTGASDPAYAEKIAQQQRGVLCFEWLAADAASWQPPKSKQAKRK